MELFNKTNFDTGAKIDASRVEKWRQDTIDDLAKFPDRAYYICRSGNSMVIGIRDIEAKQVSIYTIINGYTKETFSE